LLGLIIQNIQPAYPAGIHIVLSWGAGNCLWTKVFRDTNFAFALYANKGQLIGKTLREAEDVEISLTFSGNRGRSDRKATRPVEPFSNPQSSSTRLKRRTAAVVVVVRRRNFTLLASRVLLLILQLPFRVQRLASSKRRRSTQGIDSSLIHS